jgi:hypothetical protein
MEDDISITKTVEMEAMLIGTSKVFELGFMVYTCVMQSVGLKVKGSTLFFRDESSSSNT